MIRLNTRNEFGTQVPFEVSQEGRESIVVAISDEANIASLEQNRAALGRLADPRGLPPADRARLIKETKPIYWLSGGGPQRWRQRAPAVTAKLEINFRRPAFLERPFEVEAWAESIDGRKLHLLAEMREEGELIADARALFLEVDPEHFARGARASGDAARHQRLPW